jgi:DNA gyrase subunit A
MNTRDDDAVKHIQVVDTHDSLLFFTNTGRVLRLTAYELRADTSRNTRGVPVINVIPLTNAERIKALIDVDDLQREDTYLVMATQKGAIKRVPLSTISSIRPSGLIIMNLKPGDDLVSARLAKDGDDVIMVSEQGMSIRFPVEQVPLRQRAAGGVRGMSLRSEDRIVSMDIGGPESRLLVISKLGYGKLTPLHSYRTQRRGGVGIKTFNIRTKTGVVAAASTVDDSKEVYVVSEQAQVLRTNLAEIRSMGRATQGVTILKPAPGDAVSSIACVSDVGKIEDETEPSANASSKANQGKGNAQLPLDDIK